MKRIVKKIFILIINFLVFLGIDAYAIQLSKPIMVVKKVKNEKEKFSSKKKSKSTSNNEINQREILWDKDWDKDWEHVPWDKDWEHNPWDKAPDWDKNEWENTLWSNDSWENNPWNKEWSNNI